MLCGYIISSRSDVANRMTQTKITNNTTLAFDTLFANDEAFRPLVTPIVKATFQIRPDGELKFAREQLPINLEGEYVGDPESSSYAYEPECAFTKLATDVVVVGDAVSSRGPVSHLLVKIQVGALCKELGVIGDRHWVRRSGGFTISSIKPFETLPLIYENAFGGWDRRSSDPANHGFEPRNTVGKGFYLAGDERLNEKSETPLWLPNIENPSALIQSISDRPAPVGCGFTLPHWQPRSHLAGTYDQEWMDHRSPLLPLDFDRGFFNAASESLIAAGYLLGDEHVSITNMTSGGHLAFDLPGAKAPVCRIKRKDEGQPHELPTRLDTVIIDTRNMQLQLIWRNCFSLHQGPHEIEFIDVNYG